MVSSLSIGTGRRLARGLLVFPAGSAKLDAVNLNVVTQLLGRISQRTKLIIVGVVAFLLGLMMAGHGSESGNGRYVPWGEHSLVDTRSGQIWIINPETQRMTRGASIPYF